MATPQVLLNDIIHFQTDLLITLLLPVMTNMSLLLKYPCSIQQTGNKKTQTNQMEVVTSNNQILGV